MGFAKRSSMKVISYSWKQRTVLISVTAAVVLIYICIYTFGFSSEVYSFLQLPLPTFLYHENSKVQSPRSKRRSIAIKNVTIENGKIFKFYSFAEMQKENEVHVIKDKNGCKYENENSLHNHSEHNQSVVGRDGKFHVVTNFIHFGHGNYQSKLSYEYGVLTDDVLHARVMEVVDCIQDNLLHPLDKKGSCPC